MDGRSGRLSWSMMSPMGSSAACASVPSFSVPADAVFLDLVDERCTAGRETSRSLGLVAATRRERAHDEAALECLDLFAQRGTIHFIAFIRWRMAGAVDA